MSIIASSLIQQLVQKDEQAYNTFYIKTVDIFYRFLISRYHMTQEDIEDVLSIFYIKFRKVVVRYNDAYSFDSYMWTIFRNTVKDYFKTSKITYALDEEMVDDTEPENQLLALQEKNFQYDAIQQAMQQLSEEDYQIVFLKFIEQKTYEEIALSLWANQAAMRKRLSRALAKLRNLLDA